MVESVRQSGNAKKTAFDDWQEQRLRDSLHVQILMGPLDHRCVADSVCAGNLTQGKAGNQLMALRFCKGFALQAGHGRSDEMLVKSL